MIEHYNSKKQLNEEIYNMHQKINEIIEEVNKIKNDEGMGVVTFTENQPNTSVPNCTLFIDGNTLKFKDKDGVVHIILTN